MSDVRAEPWVTRELGIELGSRDGGATLTAAQLVQPGLRRNPRRAHLLVSTVLGKHLPVNPAAVLASANQLGDLVAAVLGDAAPQASVLGFAETATGLGHCVAARINAHRYLHSTRRRVKGAKIWAQFEEGHSHATSHLLLPSQPGFLVDDSPLVLVDDEFSTGTTAIAAIRALAALRPRDAHVLASLVDMRTTAHHGEMATTAVELGTRIESVSLATGRVVLPDGIIERVCALQDPVFNISARRRGRAHGVDLPWPAYVPDGGRHGFLASDTSAFDRAVDRAASALADQLDRSRPVIVIGHEELMYLPLRIGAALAEDGWQVAFQTTTRSPAHVLDEPGYPLRRGFRFSAPEFDEPEQRYLYNAQWPDPREDAQIALIVDPPANTPRLWERGGLVDVILAAGLDVLVAALPGVDLPALRTARERS